MLKSFGTCECTSFDHIVRKRTDRCVRIDRSAHIANTHHQEDGNLMRINGYRNTYAREGAPDQMPLSVAPAQQPQIRRYAPTQGTVLDTQTGQPGLIGGVPYGTGDQPDGNRNGAGLPTFDATQPLRPREPGAQKQPGGATDDANGNHVRDRWDDGGTHVRDMWNNRNGTRAHETWDTDGTHVRDAWSEQTGQHVRDTWAADGSHVRDAWDEQGNHLQEAWTTQGQYLRNAWNELTAQMQEMLKHGNTVDADPANNRGGPAGSAPASPGDDSSQPESEPGDVGARPPLGRRRAEPTMGDLGQRPVGDGRYGRGTAGPGDGLGGSGPAGRGHGPGGGGGSAGPTGGDGGGGGGQMRNIGPGSDAAPPNVDSGTGASQFSQAALNRLNSAPQNLMHFLDVALERLKKYGANDPEVQQWFGKNANVDEIRRTLEKMRQTLASGDYKFSLDPGTRDNWEMAHVFPEDGSHTIHVRPHMLDPVFGQNTPEVTIAHELSHFNDIGGTRDLKYGDWNALALARTNSPAAMHNAENYGMFIRQVAQLPQSA